MKPIALILSFIAMLGAVFFIGSDVQFIWMLLDDSYSGAFERMMVLEKWQELVLLFLYLLLTILLLISSVRSLARKYYTKSALFSCMAISLYAVQLVLWTVSTAQKG